MLVRKPEKLVTIYETGLCRNDKELLKKLRTTLPFVIPKNYRGISREPLEPWSKVDEDFLQKEKTIPEDFLRDKTARRRFLDLNGEDRGEWDSYVEGEDYNQAMIHDLSVAEELQKIVDLPEDFEIIEIARDTFGTKYSLLGFDIGYWAGDCFSLICDSIVMPHWHPPPPESFEKLGKRLSCLNENCLFSSVEDSEKFGKYYMSQPWAEKEMYDGEFCVIQVAAASVGD